jgi:hypothetical protein
VPRAEETAPRLPALDRELAARAVQADQHNVLNVGLNP